MRVCSKVMLILIFLVLIAICISEEVITSNAIISINNDCFVLEEKIEGLDDIRTAEIVQIVDNMEYDWIRDESNLCYLVNHKSIQEIGMELARMKNYLGENDVKEFKASLEVIKYYADSYLHFMGANLHNVL